MEEKSGYLMYFRDNKRGETERDGWCFSMSKTDPHTAA